MSALGSFHTNDDDKDHDTILTITIEKLPDEFAKVDNIIGKFDDHTDNGPFGLSVQGGVLKSQIPGATTTVKIQANGDDTWRFNYFLDLVFSDGTHQRFSFYGKQLAEHDGPLHLPL
ncbi:hypothetical protein [Streptomyces sp. NPDC088350]|uniref:hypothetical protein n=1 Tax=Streptomyces sp. NPDC088350 TaxID=3365854 RepID=UPI00382A46D9